MASTCTDIAAKAFAAVGASAPPNSYLVANRNGTYFIAQMSPQAEYAQYTGVMAVVDATATYANAAALAAALSDVAVDPQPQNAPWRDGVIPV